MLEQSQLGGQSMLGQTQLGQSMLGQSSMLGQYQSQLMGLSQSFWEKEFKMFSETMSQLSGIEREPVASQFPAPFMSATPSPCTSGPTPSPSCVGPSPGPSPDLESYQQQQQYWSQYLGNLNTDL